MSPLLDVIWLCARLPLLPTGTHVQEESHQPMPGSVTAATEHLLLLPVVGDNSGEFCFSSTWSPLSKAI